MMKLVEILARELKEWPEGETVSIVQDSDGKLKTSRSTDVPTMTSCGVWQRHAGGNDPYLELRPPLAFDYKSAIVTRADWKAELARLHSELSAHPAKKPNKDGWIRHRGGKCPVDAGVLVDVKHRDGQEYIGVEAMKYPALQDNWLHDTDPKAPGEIMRYRLHKPAEQPVIEPSNDQEPDPQADSKAAAQAAINPLEWRDRITEIGFTLASLQAERESLIQRLAGEGFKLL